MLHSKDKKLAKVAFAVGSCLMSVIMAFGLTGTAQAYQNKFTPYFQNSDIWVGDVHMNVLVTNSISQMYAYARAHRSYCKASQDNPRASIDHQTAVGKTCGARAQATWPIVSNQDYAYYTTK